MQLSERQKSKRSLNSSVLMFDELISIFGVTGR